MLAKGSGYAKDGPGEGDTPGRIHTFCNITPICQVHGHKATVITHGGDVIAEFVINPEKDYQAKNS